MELNPIDIILDFIIRVLALLLIFVAGILLMAIYGPEIRSDVADMCIKIAIFDIVAIGLCYLSKWIIKNIQ